MKYILFDSTEEAEEYREKLQAHYTETITDKKVIACIFTALDRPCLSVLTDDYPETTGEVVDSIDPPQEDIDE